MITEHAEIARYQVAEHLRAAEHRALARQHRAERQAGQRAAGGVGPHRRELAGALRRLADRLEPQPRHRRTGLTVVR